MKVQVTADVKARVIDKLKACIAIAEKHYNKVFKMPTIDYNKRGTTAGVAHLSQNHMSLNAVLLMENIEAFLKRTVPHELAHLLCEEIYPEAHRTTFSVSRNAFDAFRSSRFVSRQKREPHGHQWQEIMRVIGADPKRCHSYDTTNARVKKGNTHEYKCSGCGHTMTLGAKIHNQLVANPKARWHKGCRGSLLVLANNAPAIAPTPLWKPQAAPLPLPEPKQIVIPVHTITPVGNVLLSKKEQAQKIYNDHPTKDRQQVIGLFIAHLKMTKAGASTYYYNCQQAK